MSCTLSIPDNLACRQYLQRLVASNYFIVYLPIVLCIFRPTAMNKNKNSYDNRARHNDCDVALFWWHLYDKRVGIGHERFENGGRVLGRHPGDRGYTGGRRSPTL